MSESLQPKVVYEPVSKLEAFYTGGAVRVTRDNKHIACACGDEVKVLDVATGSVAKTLSGDSEPITALAVSPDCKTLVAASRSLSVRHWDWTGGECKRTWKPHRAPIADLAIDASGGYVASGSADRSLRVTDLAGGFTTHHFTGHKGIVLRVLFHSKQLLLFSACDSGEVRVWDLVTKSCAFSLTTGHMSAVPALCLSPDGWYLLSGGRDKVVCVWDIRNGSRVTTIPVFETLEGIAVLPAGSAFPGVPAADMAAVSSSSRKPLLFATGGDRGAIRIWRSDTGACVYTHHGSSSDLLQPAGSNKKAAAAAANNNATAAPGSEFIELLLLPGGRGLMAATGDARLLFYHPQADQVGAAGLALSRQLIGNHDEVTDLAFLYTGSSSSSSDTAQIAAAAAAAAGSVTDSQQGLVLQPGEPQRLAVATNSHDIRLFDLSDASCVGGCVGHRDIVLCLDAVRPAAGTELLASGAKDCEVRVWDPATSACLAVAAGHVAAVTAVTWSQSKAKAANYLATGGADKLLKLWDTSSLLAAARAAGSAPQQLNTVAAVAAHDKDINSIAFSPNDALLATASQDRTIKLWNLPNLVLATTLRGHKRGVWSVMFSPVDQVLLSCSGDRLVKMWSVRDGSCLRTFEGHAGGVLRCMFLTAGTQVLSAGADGLLKLWDARTGANTATFEGHEDRIWGLSASTAPLESLLATGGADARLVVWRDATANRAAQQVAEQESLVLKQQELSNALADGDFASAAKLAFQLRHPGRLLDVLRRQPGGAAAAITALQGLVGQLDQTDLATALSYCREWNTNTRNAHLAQALLRAIVSSHTQEQLLAVSGARELLDGLLVYSQRHAARLERLSRASFLLDYTLAASQVLLPLDQQDGQQEQQQQGEAHQQQEQQQQLLQQQQHAGVLRLNGHIDGNDTDISTGPGSDLDLDQHPQNRQQQQQQSSPQQQHAAAAGNGVAGSKGQQLPGWGGGDDLDDGWAIDDDNHIGNGGTVSSDEGDGSGDEDMQQDSEEPADMADAAAISGDELVVGSSDNEASSSGDGESEDGRAAAGGTWAGIYTPAAAQRQCLIGKQQQTQQLKVGQRKQVAVATPQRVKRAAAGSAATSAGKKSKAAAAAATSMSSASRKGAAAGTPLTMAKSPKHARRQRA